MNTSLFGVNVGMSADISPCGSYRYTLGRVWDEGKRVGFLMLNPSRATDTEDDPTIRRCMGFARSWGFAGIAVRNLFALRSTDPRELYKAEDPIGPGNDEAIASLVGVCPMIVAAWGVHGQIRNRDKAVMKLITEAGGQLHCLALTKDGHPKHPLYLFAGAQPIPFPPEGK